MEGGLGVDSPFYSLKLAADGDRSADAETTFRQIGDKMSTGHIRLQVYIKVQ